MKQISLTQNKETIVDDDIYEVIGHLKWYAQNRGKTYYASKNIRIDKKWRVILLHHVVMGIPLDNNEIDHIDGNGLNNQRSNLRVVSRRKNGQNLGVHRNGKLIGATWVDSKNKWIAKIKIGDRRVHIGSFDTELQAHEAYIKKAGELL